MSGLSFTGRRTSAVQPFDADLALIAALTTTAFGRALLTLADAAALRTAAALGTAAVAAIGTSGDTVPKNNTANVFSLIQTFRVDAGASANLLLQDSTNNHDSHTIGVGWNADDIYFRNITAVGGPAVGVLSASRAIFPGCVIPGSFTVATVPSAALGAGALIFVSDEVGGAVPAFSDAAAWRRVTDLAVIS